MKAKNIIDILKGQEFKSSRGTSFTLGSRPGVTESWVWEAISDLKKIQPDVIVHIYIGSGDDIVQKLGQNKVDAILTSAPLTSKNYQAVDVTQENYVLVGTPKIIDQIKNLADLENWMLIEYDRSFPFLNYVNHKMRVQMRFADVWFLNSTKLMVSAIAEGHGVGIVPEYLVADLIKSGMLATPELNLDISSDYFRVVYNSTNPQADEIRMFASQLEKIKLF